MIASVTFEKTDYNVLPYKFEAGTPNIAGVVGLGAAVTYVQGLDRAAARAHEDALLDELTAQVADLPGTRLLGQAGRVRASLRDGFGQRKGLSRCVSSGLRHTAETTGQIHSERRVSGAGD